LIGERGREGRGAKDSQADMLLQADRILKTTVYRSAVQNSS